MLAPILDPFDRAPEQAGTCGTTTSSGQIRYLAPNPPADIRRNDPHLLIVDTEVHTVVLCSSGS
jgi:hypothetical protein